MALLSSYKLKTPLLAAPEERKLVPSQAHSLVPRGLSIEQVGELLRAGQRDGGRTRSPGALVMLSLP